MATLCRERYLTREEMKTQYQKVEKQKTANKHNTLFSVLTRKRKKSFQILLSSKPWNKLVIV